MFGRGSEGVGSRCRQREGKVCVWMSKVKGEGGGVMCFVAERRESRTSRRESSRARAVSARVVGLRSEAKVEKDRFLEEGEAAAALVSGVAEVVEAGSRIVGSFITPVDCQLRRLIRMSSPPGGTALILSIRSRTFCWCACPA